LIEVFLYKKFTTIAIRQNWPIGRNVLWFIIVLAIALTLPGLGYLGGLELSGRKTLFILAFAIGLWVTEAIPPFATALLIVGFQVFFLGVGPEAANDLALEKYTRAWASPVIWLLMGGFFLSLSLTLTGIDRIVYAKFSRWFGHSWRHFLLGSMGIAAVLSMFMSNTATTALLLGMLGPTLANPNQSEAVRKCLLVGIPAAASIGGMATIIGSTPNAIAYSFLSQQNIQFGFLPWLLMGFPLLLILVPLTWFLLITIFKLPKLLLNIETEEPEVVGAGVPENVRLVRRRDRFIVVGTFSVTVLLWASAPLHLLSVSVVSLIPIVVLTVTGVIRSHDIRLLPWDTLLLIMGGMSLGESVIESGLAQFLVSKIDLPMGYPVLLSLTFGYLSVFFSTFMSNTAAAAILIPLGNALVTGHTLQLSLVIALSSSIATALPVSTPPNAVAYASGFLSSGDFAKVGLILAIVSPPLITLAIWIACGGL